MTSVTSYKDWVGRIVHGKFPLLAWLGGSEGCGVFLTERQDVSAEKAVVKLMPSEAAADRAAGWEAARELSHPHLLHVYEHGRCHVDGAEFAFVLTEYAPEVLAEIVPERALTPDEARSVLEPLIDALEYLHGKGLVHGHVTPANIMADGDVLKLTADHLLRVGVATGARKSESNDAPELARGVVTAATDVWSLGMTLVEVLTQKTPVRGQNGDWIVPVEIPEPFARIARQCLRVDAAQRCSLMEIRARLKPEAASAKPVASRVVAAQPVTQAEKPAVTPAVTALPGKSQSARLPRRWIAVAVVVIIIVFVAWFLRTRAGQSSSAEESAASAAQESSSASSVQVPAMVKGAVAEQVPPEVLRSALETIHGTVRVDVQVTVSESGNVTGAAFAEHGPSHYFANAAMQAAQQWMFKPAQVKGLPAKSIWLLKFAFTQDGDSVTATEVSP